MVTIPHIRLTSLSHTLPISSLHPITPLQSTCWTALYAIKPLTLAQGVFGSTRFEPVWPSSNQSLGVEKTLVVPFHCILEITADGSIVYRLGGIVCLSEIGKIRTTPWGTYCVDLTAEAHDPPEEPVFNNKVVLTLGSNASHVCLMHDACWKILEVYLRRPISLTRLYEVLRILELPATPTGHFQSKHQPPTEATVFPNLLPALTPLPKRSSRVRRLQKACTEANADVFHTLPRELRHEIASYLSTLDFYNLRLASRAMGGIFFSQSFWKTRFECHGDRYFLGSADGGWPKISRRGNWHLLYYWTHEKVLSQRLRNRRDIWWRCRLIAGVMYTRFSFPRPAESRAIKALRWRYMNTLWPSSQPSLYLESVRSEFTFSGYFSLPQSLRQIAVSLLGDTYESYVTGLEFIGEDKTVKIGYVNSRSHIIRDIRPFRGFKIAWSRQGVHAITFDTNATDCSWIGRFNNTYCVRDMTVASNVAAVQMEFDVGVAALLDVSLYELTLCTGIQSDHSGPWSQPIGLTQRGILSHYYNNSVAFFSCCIGLGFSF